MVGIETSGNTHWFESVLARLGHELWIGDATNDPAAGCAEAEARPASGEADSEADGGESLSHDLDSDVAERDLRQLLMHRHHLVRMRTRVKNQLQHIALNQGVQQK